MSAQPKLTDYVNPFRGTTTLWETEDLGYERHREARTWGAETLPGASLPNAMVQATPVTCTTAGLDTSTKTRPYSDLHIPARVTGTSATFRFFP